MAGEYDLLVIGGGSGGLAHAQRAAEYGARAAVVEYGPLGGTCVNVGCVPKKVMWYAAETRHHLDHAADYGFTIDVGGHDWAGLKARRDAYVTRLNGIYENNLDRRGVDYIQGAAKFVDPHTLAVGDELYRAERIVIATGGRPMVPDIPGAGYGIVSDDFFTLEERPQRVLIAGSGYIAVELGGVFNALGSDVNIVVRKDHVVRSFDTMLSEEVMEAMENAGIRFDTRVIPAKVEKLDDSLVMTSDDGRRFGPVDCVLWAIGREPNSDTLALDAAGVMTDEQGFIPVDKFQTTNVGHIYAIGDVTGAQALTPVAIAAGRRMADRIYGGMEGRHLDYRLVPADGYRGHDRGGCPGRARRCGQGLPVAFHADVLRARQAEADDRHEADYGRRRRAYRRLPRDWRRGGRDDAGICCRNPHGRHEEGFRRHRCHSPDERRRIRDYAVIEICFRTGLVFGRTPRQM